MKIWPFQYQGFVQPPPTDPPPTVTPLSWDAKYSTVLPGRTVPALAAAVLAGAFFFCPQTGSVTEQAAAAQDGGVVTPTQLVQYTAIAGSFTASGDARPTGAQQGGTIRHQPPRIQYQSFAAPFTVGAAPVPTIDGWGPKYPDRVWYRTLLTAEYQQFVSLPISPITTPPQGWYPAFPDGFPPKVVRTADQLAFTQPPYIPGTDLRWKGTWPDRIDRPVVRAADQQAFVGPLVLQFTDLRWQGSWPDRIDRLVVRAADQLAFTTGQTGSVIPYTDLRWEAVYPDILFPPPRLRADLQQTAALDPFPRPNVATVTLEWLPTYPDRVPTAARLQEYPSSVLAAFLPLFDLRWLPGYPDKIWPLSGLPAALQQAFVLDPFPRPNLVVPLSWLAQYPDFVLRNVLLTAQQLAWSSTASTLIWSGPVPTPCPPCPDTGGAGQPDVIIGRGW